MPLLIEELIPLYAPGLLALITKLQNLYAHTLIQSDGQSLQWRGWFAANNMTTPTQYGLAFDRSSMGISAAVDGLGVVLESNLFVERELATGKLVCPLRGVSNSVRYVGHHLVHPRTHRNPEAFMRFKGWLLAELEGSRGTGEQ